MLMYQKINSLWFPEWFTRSMLFEDEAEEDEVR